VKRIIVFDLDDTLYPERAFVRSALTAAGEYAFTAWGLTRVAAMALGLFDTGRRKDIFRAAFLAAGHAEPSHSQVAELLKVYREHHPPALPWHADAKAVVPQLATLHSLELISDGYLPTQANKFRALGLGRWIPKPIFTEFFGRDYWKPSPRAFQEVMGRHPGASFAYVADNPAKDFVAPRALGWTSLHIHRPDGVHVSAVPHPEGAPDITLATLTDLPHVLASLT
jgi:putative hydrolase of the HAD superfamily